MNQKKLLNLLIGLHLTNKSEHIGDKHNCVIFKVLSFAHKNDIKSAVENLFKVKVHKVRTLNIKGKSRVFKRMYKGKTKKWKKAYIVLKSGYNVDLIRKMSVLK
jgi:large subunit ribosomal protein L23